MKDIGWILVVVFSAWVIGSMTLHNERTSYERQLVNACTTDLECEVLTDVLERVKPKSLSTFWMR